MMLITHVWKSLLGRSNPFIEQYHPCVLTLKLQVLYQKYLLTEIKDDLRIVSERYTHYQSLCDYYPHNQEALRHRNLMATIMRETLEDEKEIQTQLVKLYKKLINSGKLAGDSLAKIKASWSASLTRCKWIKQKLREVSTDVDSEE